MIKFYVYYFFARVRGIGRTYNKLPKEHSTSCGITDIKEIKTMYLKHGWIPYCKTKTGTSFITL